MGVAMPENVGFVKSKEIRGWSSEAGRFLPCPLIPFLSFN